MPKVSLYEDADMPGGAQRIRCEVGWAKGCDVQIAVTRLADGLDPANEPVSFSESAARATITVLDSKVAAGTATHAGPPPTPGEFAWQGQYMRVTRQQINHLIRTLREARDAAYGRDE